MESIKGKLDFTSHIPPLIKLKQTRRSHKFSHKEKLNLGNREVNSSDLNELFVITTIKNGNTHQIGIP